MYTREEQSQMMQNPEKWPNWPILPLKKHGSQGNGFSKLEMGILWAEKKPIIYLVNMYNLPKDLTTAPQTVFDDWDSLLDAGWEVD